MPHESERISQNVTDISSASQLLRYALAGQLEQLKRQRSDLSQAKIADAARLAANPRSASGALSHALRLGPTYEQLLKLDEIIGALAADLDGTGGLASLNLRLSPEGRSQAAHVPPCWTGRILRDRPSTELEVLAQASALLSAF